MVTHGSSAEGQNPTDDTRAAPWWWVGPDQFVLRGRRTLRLRSQLSRPDSLAPMTSAMRHGQDDEVPLEVPHDREHQPQQSQQEEMCGRQDLHLRSQR